MSDHPEIVDTLEGQPAIPVGVGQLSRLPAQWHPIAASAEWRVRQEAALELWNHDFLDLVPGFAREFNERLVDIRPYFVGDEPALVYIARSDRRGLVSWVGYDPRGAADLPAVVPAAVRGFLVGVHAGFVSGVDAGFGPTRPAALRTLAELAGFPDGIPGWDDDMEIPSTRLWCLATDGGQMRYCLSPDLPPGEVALVYQGDLEAMNLGVALDKLMTSRLTR
jgi:hypothetical protein